MSGLNTKKPLRMWVAYGILALNGGDEIVDKRALLPSTLPQFPLGWSSRS